MVNPDDLVTTSEAAEYFRVNKSTVWLWIKKAKLRAVNPDVAHNRPCLFRLDDLARLEVANRDRSHGGRKRKNSIVEES